MLNEISENRHWGWDAQEIARVAKRFGGYAEMFEAHGWREPNPSAPDDKRAKAHLRHVRQRPGVRQDRGRDRLGGDLTVLLIVCWRFR
jgi:hypothetical protein